LQFDAKNFKSAIIDSISKKMYNKKA
jgi:hypothetical protein